MTKLRNIGYLRFGSKIRQGFAGGITSLSPLLSPSPLSRSRGQKMRAQRKGAEFYIRGGSLPPPCRAAGPLPPTGGAAGSLLKYKTPTLPSAPSFSAHEIQRGERERGGVMEVKKPAKPCRIFDPNRR